MYKYRVKVMDGGYRFSFVITADDAQDAAYRVRQMINGVITDVYLVAHLQPLAPVCDNIIKVDFKRKVRVHV